MALVEWHSGNRVMGICQCDRDTNAEEGAGLRTLPSLPWKGRLLFTLMTYDGHTCRVPAQVRQTDRHDD